MFLIQYQCLLKRTIECHVTAKQHKQQILQLTTHLNEWHHDSLILTFKRSSIMLYLLSFIFQTTFVYK